MSLQRRPDDARRSASPSTRDAFDEINENFSVTLSSPVERHPTPIDATGVATITDDDELSAPLTLSVADTSVIEQLDPQRRLHRHAVRADERDR